MKRDELIEAMARAIFEGRWAPGGFAPARRKWGHDDDRTERAEALEQASAALAALEAARPDVAAVLRGEGFDEDDSDVDAGSLEERETGR